MFTFHLLKAFSIICILLWTLLWTLMLSVTSFMLVTFSYFHPVKYIIDSISVCSQNKNTHYA